MLKIRNFSIKYDKVIIENADLDFERGKITVIQGESGSGKSSILNVLGLMQSSSCEYYLNNKNISELTTKQKAEFRLKNIGFIFQHNNLLDDFTALENIKIPMILNENENAIQDADKIIEYVGLGDIKNKYPKIISGGEEQRVTIGRAISNDAGIILADEPTAALDNLNKENILGLFKKLAYENNKIVIIVTHDRDVSAIADKIYEIKDKKINCIYESEQLHTENINISPETDIDLSGKDNYSTKIAKFIRFYNKKRKADRILNHVFVIITAIISAIAILFLTFGNTFTQKQEKFVNAISDKSLFVVNDPIGINANTDYSSAHSFTKEQIEKIKSVPNVQKVYPYFEFKSYGYNGTKDNNILTYITVKNENGSVSKSLQYDGNPQNSSNNNSFSVIPTYPEEDLEYLSQFETKKNSFELGVLLTYSMALKLDKNLQELVGKEITIDCLVPAKLYETTATRMNNTDTVGEKIDIDKIIYKKVKVTQKISGILSDEYKPVRTEGNTDCILLPIEQMQTIIDDNLEYDFSRALEGFPEKTYMPSAVTVFANDYAAVGTIKNKIETISPSFNINSSALDVNKIKNNVSYIRHVMIAITGVFILIAVIMFSSLYYLKNRNRKKEIGILKAIGLTQTNILRLFLTEMFWIAIKAFLLATVLAVGVTIFGNSMMSAELFSITPVSILIAFLLSVIIVLFSGVLPVIRASKVDPIDAIRELNK